MGMSGSEWRTKMAELTRAETWSHFVQLIYNSLASFLEF